MAKKESNKADDTAMERKFMIGPKLNFASSEAYKLLRTNVMFSFPATEKCPVIGLTSTFKGEGKSLTSINLAYTLAETKKRVLLIEGDMRLPNFAPRLNLKPTPGVSNLLVELDSLSDAIQKAVFQTSDGKMNVHFDVITSGSIPPNPSELMQSDRMEHLINTLKEFYDIIVLDLPPVTVVTDALLASRYVSGTAVVVRNERASKRGLSETMRQLRQVSAKIIGFIYTNADVTKSKSYSRYYSKYYKKEYKA
jgi:capsular exopolysaccharide synthesis family protein